MKISVQKRRAGEVPWGALAMLPLFAMPLGGWLVEQGHVDFGTCAVKSGLGFPCLSCGATRATLHLLHGEWLAAVAMQPLTIAIYGLLALWGLASLVFFIGNQRAQLELSRLEDRTFKGALIVLPMLNWAYLIAAGI